MVSGGRGVGRPVASCSSGRGWVRLAARRFFVYSAFWDDLDHILNTTGELPENLSDLDSEDEGQVDNLEFEELYE
ncbi:hypothetical protein Hamer_G013537 [Homarus americanus]|uniref:Uncharacterized protein n=1 Tax=Homarus americanus TaxID=6706 RepID=A0A8J5KE73_HOMAM|nr:hypothetical protein Hamer_G013537 [Homarus americanus]